MDEKRNSTEWRDAIVAIIKKYGGQADYGHFYSNIPQVFQLTERELRPSTSGANFEAVWRGTLRGYLCDLVQRGVLIKTGKSKSPVFQLKI